MPSRPSFLSRALRWLFSFSAIFMGLALLFFYGPSGVFVSAERAQDTTIIIKPKTPTFEIAKQLTNSNILSTPWFFLTSVALQHSKIKLKAGEYLIPKCASTWEIIEQMAAGRTVVRKFTIPEGLSVHQVVTLLQNTESLSGTIHEIPQEGMLLPETYLYSYGDKRQEILNRMKKAMQQLLQDLWLTREIEEPLIHTPQEALILASIVEKETSIPHERARIAGVFLNRLRLGMKLQSDPTVSYALTEGKRILERPLTRNDLGYFSPFNTYAVTGLPPQPIACPGRASLEAVLKPEKTEALYFVANGQGGHAFNKSLDDHNRSVSEWRKTSRQNLER